MTNKADRRPLVVRFDRGLLIWLGGVVIALVVLVALASAALVRHAMLEGPRLSARQAELVEQFASLPSIALSAVGQLAERTQTDPVALLISGPGDPRAVADKFPDPTDRGFLLVPGPDPVTRQAGVRLIRVADGRVLARWMPDWSRVLAEGFAAIRADEISPARAQVIHPVLMRNGDIIFNLNNDELMVRLPFCDAQPRWVRRDFTHHSIEWAGDGTLLTSSISHDGFASLPAMSRQIRDDAIARVSVDGQLLARQSFSNILRNNELDTLLFGFIGPRINVDPIHLNQVTEATSKSKFWNVGDLLISARHMSTIFLYRPSTGKVIWYKTGPWLNQHSAKFVDDHTISVFDNHSVTAIPRADAFLGKNNFNRIVLYDFSTDRVSEPYARMLEKMRPRSSSAGRAQILENGDAFLEDSNNGRLFRTGRDRLRWAWTNRYDAHRVGVLGWSRYLTPEQVQPALAAIRAQRCSDALAKPNPVG